MLRPEERNIPFMKYYPEENLLKVIDGALHVLENTGVVIDHPDMRGTLRDLGANIVNGSNRVRLPPDLIQRMMEKAPRRIIYGARYSEQDLIIENSCLACRTVSGAEGMMDIENSAYRKATLNDLKEWTRLADALENIDYCGTLYPDDVPLQSRDIICVHTMLQHTTKHILVQPYNSDNLQRIINLCLAVQGDTEKIRHRPILSILTSCQSPLKYNRYAIDILMLAGKYGIPVELNTMPIAGATAPVTIAGLLVLMLAEQLSGLVILQASNPGAPIIFRPIPEFMDMRRGLAMVGPLEGALAAAAFTQLVVGQLGLPTASCSLNSDALTCDGQSILERFFHSFMPAYAGANVIVGAGHYENYNTCDPVQLVMDDEIIAMLFRSLKGFDVDSETLAIDPINNVGPGGNFLELEHTLQYFRKEYFFPKVADHLTRAQFIKDGGQDFWMRAAKIAQELLLKHQVPPLEATTLREMEKILST